jgi:peptide/nickel transport system substrate-binding protein
MLDRRGGGAIGWPPMSLEAALRRVLFALLALLAVVLWIAATGERKRAGELIIAISQEPDSLDPVFGEMVASSIIRGALLHELVVYDDTWQPVPDLAARIPTVENGGIRLTPDGKMQTVWHLRPDAKWSDGQPVVAQDFIFTHKVTMDPAQPVISRDPADRVERLEAPDPKTLLVHWKEPYAYSTRYRVLRAIPAHIYEPRYRKEGPNFHKTAYDGMVGNGPYVLERWIPGDRLTLVPNPHWSGPKLALQRVTYRIIPNTNSQIVNLLSHTVDALSNLSITLDQALELERRWGHLARPTLISGLVWEHIDMRTEDPLLSDPRVRKALLLAIDREMIARELFDNRQMVADSWLPARHYGYKSVLPTPSYDPGMAKALLEEAGWKAGPGGVRANDQGQPLVLELMTTAGNQVREQVQQVIQSHLARVGVKIEIRNLPAKVFFGEIMRKRKFKHMVMFAWTMDPLSDGNTLWASKFIPSPTNNFQGQNAAGWRNAEVDLLIEKLQKTIPTEGRRQMLHRLQECFAADLPSIPLFFRTDVSVVPGTMKGWRPTGNLVPETWNAHAWALPGAGPAQAQ